MIQRIDELCAPPEIGRFYLVPTVRGDWSGSVGDWPVLGPKHSDAQCLDFDYQHYHLDARFMAVGEDDEWRWRSVMAAPLMVSWRINSGGLPAPVWRRRKCRRHANPFQEYLHSVVASDKTRWRCHFDQWAGKQARHDGRGWVCPHRSVPLAGQPVVDGAITCPLHLLKIDAATGTVLPAPTSPSSQENAP